MRRIILALVLCFGAPAVAASAKADSWTSIAASNYGSAHYAPLVADCYPKMKMEEETPRALMKVPPLGDCVAFAVANTPFEALLRQLAGTGAALAGIEGELRPLRIPAGAKEPLALPTPLKVRLQNLASQLQITRSGTQATQEKYVPPKKALAELDAAIVAVEALSAGKLDAKGDDVQRVHRNIAIAMSDIIRWYRAGFR